MLIIALMGSGLFACSSKELEDIPYGNTNSNRSNAGILAAADGWVYFADSMDGFKLKKKRSDDTELTTLNDSLTKDINIAGDLIYYVAEQDSEIYLFKMKTDGSGKVRISDIHINAMGSVIINEESIFFSNADDEGKLYRMELDGTNPTKMNDLFTFKLAIDQEWIFYIAYSEDTQPGIRKIRLDGTEDTSLILEGYPICIPYKGWLYYTNTEGVLYRVKYDGKTTEKISTKAIGSLSIYDDVLYYSNQYKKGLLTNKLDGSQEESFSDDFINDSLGISIDGTWLYFNNSEDNNRTYRIKLDQSKTETLSYIETVEPNPTGTPLVLGLGTSNTNLINSSYFVRQGDWIYYQNIMIENSLNKIKIDNTGKTVLLDHNVSYINIISDWLYFVDGNYELNRLARIKTDGTEYGIILDHSCTDLIVKDDWMYFIDISNDRHIYKIKIDGTQLTELSTESAIKLNLSGDSLIYTYHPDSDTNFKKIEIHKIATDGLKPLVLRTSSTTSASFSGMVTDNLTVYYSSGASSAAVSAMTIKKVNLDATGYNVLISDPSSLLGLADEWLYYVYYTNSTEKMIRRHKDGTDFEIISELGNYTMVSILEDKIVYYDGVLGNFYMMNLDGSSLQVFLTE